MKLTESESAVLEFVRNFLIEKGIPPTVREIGANFGWSSPTWPSQILRRLHRKKQIVFNPKLARGINLTNEWATLMRRLARLPLEDLRKIADEYGT